MFRPAIQRTEVLVGMAIFSLIVLYTVSNIRIQEKSVSYDVKIKAANRMEKALIALKYERMAKAIFIDDVNDPNETGLIGQQNSYITTDEGDLDAKISVLDPNVAGMLVDMLLEANVKKGDTVAVSMTGSMPGANIALLCAIEEMELFPLLISSVGASKWGANYENFTWLDMESFLYQEGIISHVSELVSIGGGSDIGRRLSPFGRQQIVEATERNQRALIKSRSLGEAIENRMDYYKSAQSSPRYGAYINVGGGAASLGNAAASHLIPPGLTTRVNFDKFPSNGTMVQFGKQGVPVIHILNIKTLFQAYQYPFAAVPTPPIGEGVFFSSRHYSLLATSIALVTLLGMIIAIGVRSKRKIKHHLQQYEPENYA